MKFFPKSADGFLSAMMMAENALLRDFSLRAALLRFLVQSPWKAPKKP